MSIVANITKVYNKEYRISELNGIIDLKCMAKLILYIYLTNLIYIL